MSLYSIGEVARICGINPVTLRAWQRRYGLLKPQRSEGGHRLFDDQDLETIQTILAWINRGVPVGQVKALLEGTLSPLPSGWSQSEQRLLSVLQEDKGHKLRQTLTELGRDYPGEGLVNNVLRPLRARLAAKGSTLFLRGLLDGALIEHAVMCMNAARKNPGIKVLLIGWGEIDRIELWLEAIARSQQGVKIELLPEPFDDPYLDGVKAQQILIWAEGRLTGVQRNKFSQWQEMGLPVLLLGSAAVLLQTTQQDASPHLPEDGGYLDDPQHT
ncbi:MAG: MerR family transcriptional regulator [Rouxiella aceris]|uniref:MerR family transcriptional regulator n=1 Tax=Rouxiella aceris TaxID=2703884 RepID=UPI00284BAACB|nr:MerR family transcriptional regulator [Rouxiella aceris]MDR3434268.1 MerR family transcriptional regulator [Rouxiella aceris]